MEMSERDNEVEMRERCRDEERMRERQVRAITLHNVTRMVEDLK